jgi:hypothetical protein
MHHQPTVASVAAAEKRVFASAVGRMPGCAASKKTWKAGRRRPQAETIARRR